MWDDSFESEISSPASDEEINKLLHSVFAPLTDTEIQELCEEHKKIVGSGHFDPPFNPRLWRLPKYPLPSAYIEFLRFSHGGYFEGKSRDLDPLFSTDEVREYMLAYNIPHWMPDVCPFGFDGGGTFYLFDMRLPPIDGDYPILFTHSGCLTFEDSVKIAESFSDLVATALGDE